MNSPSRPPSRLVLRCAAAAAALLAAAPLQAGAFLGIDQTTDELLDLDALAGGVQSLGVIANAPAAGFSDIDARADGTMLAVVNGVQFGYEIWRIDTQALSAVKLCTVAVPNSGAWIAADPNGTHAWVMGPVQVSLGTSLHRIDLATGLPKSIGTTFAGVAGLGFDTAGNLYSTLDQGQGPVLLRIDKTNINNSTPVGTGLNGVDNSMSLDFASDAGSGMLHCLSLATLDLHNIDTTLGSSVLVTTLTPGSPVGAFAEGPCKSGSAIPYGTGCAGSGGFVPKLSWSGCPESNAAVELTISQGLGGANALLLFGAGQGAVPVGSGCTLRVVPILAGAALPLGGAGPGNGSITIPGNLPSGVGGLSVTLQAWVIDPAVGIGGAGSNGLELTIAQ
jgi:hypothetical protein